MITARKGYRIWLIIIMDFLETIIIIVSFYLFFLTFFSIIISIGGVISENN